MPLLMRSGPRTLPCRPHRKRYGRRCSGHAPVKRRSEVRFQQLAGRETARSAQSCNLSPSATVKWPRRLEACTLRNRPLNAGWPPSRPAALFGRARHCGFPTIVPRGVVPRPASRYLQLTSRRPRTASRLPGDPKPDIPNRRRICHIREAACAVTLLCNRGCVICANRSAQRGRTNHWCLAIIPSGLDRGG